MQQQIAVMTLGVFDLSRSRRFYVDGFRWKPIFENDEIIFYQMHGFVFGTWERAGLAADAERINLAAPEPLRLPTTSSSMRMCSLRWIVSAGLAEAC